MKLNEIMIVRKNDGRNQLKIFQVDDSTLARLTRIRGNLYKDDPRLKLARDLSTPEPEPKISPEMQARADAAYQIYLAEKATKDSQSLPVVPQPLTFEEQIQKDWKTLPGIRAEFVSLASYTAYCRAVRDGRCKVYGR